MKIQPEFQTERPASRGRFALRWCSNAPILLALTLLALPTGHALAQDILTRTSAVHEIILVFKTHFDIGFTDMASNVVQRYRTSMIDKALDVADQNRDLPAEMQFVWTIPGWPMK